jgi:GxxExxY protein
VLRRRDRLDLLVEGELTVELKALDRHHDVDMAQVISSLKAGNVPLELIRDLEARRMKDGIRRMSPLL